jgi:hypothetical protein
MDNDHLFVCFSEETQSPPNGEPPFHNEIKAFACSLTEATFSDFYEKRFEWHWYPIITSGFSSFPVHGGLPEELNDVHRLQSIGYAASICVREDSRRFISALGLLALLCRAVETPQEVPALTKHFMRIRDGVTRNAIDPNIPYWFSKIALFQLSSGVVPDGYRGAFDRTGLNAPDKGWRGYGTSLDFPPAGENGLENCPDGEELIQREVQGISGGDFVLEFQRSALHADSKYWIWLYRNVSANPVWHWYVYAVMTPDGNTSVHRRSMHSVVNVTAEELIAQHAFEQSNE